MSNGPAPRQLLPEPQTLPATLRRKTAPQKDQVSCGSTCRTRDTRRSGAEKEALGVAYPAPLRRGHRRQTVKPPTARARRQGRSGQLLEKASTAGRARGSAGGSPSNTGNNALKDERRATSEVIEETVHRLRTILGGAVAEAKRCRPFSHATLNYQVSGHNPLPRRNNKKTRTPNALEAHRAANAPQSAVAVRWSAGVGRTTDTLRYLYAASPLQRLL